MNCKFCNNFIPDDAKICSICGKSVEEEAIVKVEAAETAVAPSAPESATPEKEKTYKKKSLKLPIIIILISVAAFIGIYVFGGAGKLAALIDGSKTDSTVSSSDQSGLVDTDNEKIDLGESTDDTVKNNASDDVSGNVLVNVASNGVAALIGVSGIALFGKRVSGNRKAKKQGN